MTADTLLAYSGVALVAWLSWLAAPYVGDIVGLVMWVLA